MSCKTVFSAQLSSLYRHHRCIFQQHRLYRKLTNSEVRKKRNELFGEEKKRQMGLIKRVEKIKVEYKGTPEDCTLIMNKDLSTPFNCAMHIQELLMSRSALALVNGQPWDLHRPLTEDCQLKFLHFKDEDPAAANSAFWRTCSFILGHILETAFREQHYIELCSFPPPNIHSGSFVHDVDIKMGDWKPSTSELRCMGMIGRKLRFEDLKFERLEIDAKLAEKMFEDNRFKKVQIPHIASLSKSGSSVTVYKMGEHIDISRGPLISSTHLIGRYDLVAVHNIESPEFGPLKRFQGLGLPTQLHMHYWTYESLHNRAAKLNMSPVPTIRILPAKKAVNGD
ncbi:large ribosomal subunit protein mL39-like [Liolophura sinensis]|uniref:large ribosomal subunit protein mL39-like n=1 Tax=Liolophura sinensis TaxID=3198878 RepID=UPI0031587F4B